MGIQEATQTGTWRNITVAVAIAGMSLAAVWWSTRSSLAVLGAAGQIRACPAIYPAPPSCYPTWHVQVAALATLAILAVLAGVVVAIRRTRGRAAPALHPIAAVVGLSAWWVVADPNRFLPIW